MYKLSGEDFALQKNADERIRVTRLQTDVVLRSNKVFSPFVIFRHNFFIVDDRKARPNALIFAVSTPQVGLDFHDAIYRNRGVVRHRVCAVRLTGGSSNHAPRA